MNKIYYAGALMVAICGIYCVRTTGNPLIGIMLGTLAVAFLVMAIKKGY